VNSTIQIAEAMGRLYQNIFGGELQSPFVRGITIWMLGQAKQIQFCVIVTRIEEKAQNLSRILKLDSATWICKATQGWRMRWNNGQIPHLLINVRLHLI